MNIDNPKERPFILTDRPDLADLQMTDPIGEISRRIGRNLAREQDTLVHKFAEAYPDVPLDDVCLVHGFDRSNGQYTFWVRRLTDEEKSFRTLNRKDDARIKVLEEALKFAKNTFTIYAKIHRDKGTAIAELKARENEQCAARCEAALSQPVV